MNINALGFQEQVIYRLRSLFETYGYSHYKMNKFEEYDLYARNKDFLLSDSVITFTDFGGKLMALKPDVTLSIVKNSRDDLSAQQKLYYNEHVYRVGPGGHSFQEMSQIGMELLGDVDDVCILEVLTLAARSLKAISDTCILDVSHLGILSDALTAAGIPGNRQDKAMKLIGEKNFHELKACCRDCGAEEETISRLIRLLSASGSPMQVLSEIRDLLPETETADRLTVIFHALAETGLADVFRFDFSAVDDIRYYNGVVFKGFVPGVPTSVLSGGQYDNLMGKMRRNSHAIGFAVYIDRLERLEPAPRRYDVDTVLLYDTAVPMADVMRYAAKLREAGITVMVQRQKPETVQYRQLIKLWGSEVEILENNA